MSVFHEIAKRFVDDDWPLTGFAVNQILKINLGTQEQAFISNSALEPNKKHPYYHMELPDLTGEGQDANGPAGFSASTTGKSELNYYTKPVYKQGGNKINPEDEMTGLNISWARTRLEDIGDSDFNKLFMHEIWKRIQDFSKVSYKSEDFFYFFASALQILVDPHWEKMVNLDEEYEEIISGDPYGFGAAQIDEKRYEPLVGLIPSLFRDYLETHDDNEKNGTYAGIFQLGPGAIEDPADSSDIVSSVGQFYKTSVKKFWYRILGTKLYTYRLNSEKKLYDSFRDLKEIFALFDVATILDLEADLENNATLYKDYESDWASKSKPFGNSSNMTYSEASLFWNIFIEKFYTGDIDQSLVEELKREKYEQGDIYKFEPDSCKLPSEEEEEELCTLGCKPNPSATVLDWTTAPNEQPYLNERTCEYWAPIVTKHDNVIERPASAIINENIESGIKLILDFVGKESTEDIILSLVSQVSADYFVDFRTGAKVRVLIKLPTDATFLLEEKEESSESSPTEASSEFPLNVVLTREDIRGDGSMFNLVSRAIGNKYSQQYEILLFRGESSGLPKNILLKKEGDRIRQFKKALIGLLKDQKFKFNPLRKKQGILEAVEIGFKKDFSGIEYIKANNVGCEAVELGINKDKVSGGAGWNSFLKKSVANYPTTLAFVANIPSIYDSVTSDNPIVVDSFLKKYYYPKIEEQIGQELTMVQEFVDENGCNAAELAANLLKPAAILGSEVAGTALSYPELFFKSVAQKTCLTTEGKEQEDEKYKVFKDIEQRWKDVDTRKLFTGDQIFADLPHKLEEVSNLKELYAEILDKLGVCGISSLVMDGLGCLLKGLDIDVSMEVLVKSFLKNATDKEMEKMFFAMDPSLQKFIRDSVSEITSIPLPWEANYRPGSYQAAGVKYSAEYSAASGSLEKRLEKTGFYADEQEEEEITTKYDEDGELKSFRAKAKTTIEEQEQKFKSSDPVPTGKLDADGNEIMVAPPDRVSAAPGLGPRGFAGPFAHAGSVGTALDAIADNAIIHLKDALVKAIEENIISAQVLMKFIDKLPGASLVKGAITEILECPLPPLFSPPLDDILKTLELDFCNGHYAITLPVIRKMPARPWMDVKTILIEAAEDALEQLVVRSITLILEKILSISLNVSCEMIKDVAGILKDVAGGANFREIVANNLCGDSLNDGELNASLNKLNAALGSLGLPGVPKPTDQDMGDFMDGTSAILTQQELLDLLDGEATTEAVSYVRQVVDGIPALKNQLPTDDHIRDLFVGMGRIFDREAIRDRIRSASYKPISPAICASPAHLELFDTVRCSILQEKGLTEDECAEQLEKLKEKTLQDFDDLANVLNENYFGDLDVLGDPTCPETGIYPGEDPETKKQTQEMFNSNDDAINSIFMKELLTKRGVLNMILSDTQGAGFKKHNEFLINFFGNPSAENLGPFGFYVNDSGSAGPAAILSKLVSGFPMGFYPDKVAPYLQDILSDTLEVDFNNTSSPNLTLNFDIWDRGPLNLGPSYLKIDYNYDRDDDKLINMKIYSEDDKFDEPLIFNAPQSCDRETYERIESLSSPDRDPTLSNQAYVFGNIGRAAWSEYTTNQAEEIESHFSGRLFEYLTEKSIEKFALKISENVRAFDFGYDPNAKTTTSSLDHNEYGGTEKNPAFYVIPPKYSGWMGLYDDIIPETDDCSRVPILNFSSVSEKTADYSDKLKEDPRLQIPAECAIDTERPFDRIMPKAALAGCDGAIRSTVRLYVMQSFIQGLPSFSLFDPKFPQVYNDTLSSYIAEKIKIGLLNTGRNFRSKRSRENYYYTFLEEVVQNFGKKVDLGEITPNSSQLSAMEVINDVQAQWQKPPRKPRISYKKRLHEKYLAWISAAETSCLVLLNYYISEQVEEVGKLFSEALKPSIPNLESWIFGSPNWMSAGSISSEGPMDVATYPLDPMDPTTAKILAIDLQSMNSYGEGYFPFILEKYIKVEPLPDAASSVAPQIFGLDYWKREVENLAAGKPTGTLTGKALSPDIETMITKNLASWSYGLRISMIMSETMLYSSGPFDQVAFDESIADDQVNAIKSLKFGPKDSRRYVIPVASAEVPMGTPTTPTIDLIDKYDINCMISELIATPEYKTLFNYCIPLQSLLSLVTIYITETFLLSIGEEWDSTAGESSQFKRWNKDSNFKKTKKNLRRLFEGFYHSRDPNYKDEEMETNEEKTREKLKVKKRVPSTKQIAWWKKRRQVPKPASECE
jgi:hypothetical protein